MKRRPRRLATAPVVPVPQNGSSTRSSGRELDEDHAREQRLRLLRRMQLLAVAALEPLLAGAQRQRPVGAHLDVFVAGLERLVVERVAACAPASRAAQISVSCALVKRRPRKFGIGLDLRHTTSLRIQKPEILQDRADAEDVVIRADHPERGRRLHHAPAGDQPGAGEVVIGGKARELVPVVIDGIDARIVGPLEVALRAEDCKADRRRRDRRMPAGSFAISATQSPTRMRCGCGLSETAAGRPEGAPRRDTTMTQDSDSGDAVGDAGPTTDRPAS